MVVVKSPWDLQSRGFRRSPYSGSIWEQQSILKIVLQAKHYSLAKDLVEAALIEGQNHSKELETQKKIPSFMEPSGEIRVEECHCLKKDLNQAQVGLETVQNNTAGQLLSLTGASKNSAGRNGTIISTPKLKGKHMKREKLWKQLFLENLRKDLDRILTMLLISSWHWHTCFPLGMSILLAIKPNIS